GNSDGMFFPPQGVVGGGTAPPVGMYIISMDGKRRVLRTMANDPIYPGERCVVMSSGGGGYGKALNRDVKRVQDDVMDGLVSIKRAREVYGVVVDPDTYEVDYEASEKLRKRLNTKKSRSQKQKKSTT
ncbi:MAG TPA: hypothetical protein VEI28_03300, partial [Thermodesulfovibrionales bacterium]|nr:hypothetical protein [Thermodesulfovibrionales bacterium]